jgi:PAS domain S-box-containing protein
MRFQWALELALICVAISAAWLRADVPASTVSVEISGVSGLSAPVPSGVSETVSLQQSGGDAGGRVVVFGVPHPVTIRGMVEGTRPEGEPQGYVVDVARAAAEASGITPHFVWLRDTENSRELLESGRIDVIAPLSIHEQYLEEVEYTAPVLVARGAIFTRAGEAGRTDEAWFRGVRVGAAQAGVGHQWCMERSIPVKPYRMLKEALQAVASGEIDVAISTELAGKFDIERHGIQGLRCTTFDYAQLLRSFAFATRKDDERLLHALNGGLAVISQDGRLDTIYAKWIERWQPANMDSFWMSRRFAFWGVMGLVLCGLTLGAWILLQRSSLGREKHTTIATTRLYHAVFDSTEDAILVYDPETQVILECNAAAERMYGRGPGELHGTNTSEITENSGGCAVSGRTLDGQKQGMIRGNNIRKNGELFEIEASVSEVEYAGRRAMLAAVRDVTERQQLIHALERERRLFLGGPVVMFRWRMTAECGVDYLSENISQFGYTPADFVSGRVRFLELIHPEDLPRVLAEIDGAQASGATKLVQEYRFKTADGRWIWVSDYTVPIRDEHGEFVAAEGYVQDVSARREAFTALQVSETRLRTMAEMVPALVYVYFVGDDGRRERRFANSKIGEWCRIFPSMDPGSDYSKTIRDSIHPDDREEYDARTAKSRAESVPFDFEYRLRDREGQYRWLHTRLVPERTAEGTLWHGINLDVTNLRSAQQSALSNERRLKSIFDNSHDAIIVFDPTDETIIDANDQALALYGYSREEFVGGSFTRVAAEERLAPGRITSTLTEGTGRFRALQRRADGTLINVDISASVIIHEGHPFIVSFNRDVTAELETQERLRIAIAGAELGTWSLDFASNKIHADEGYFRLFGLSAAPGWHSRETFFAKVMPEDVEKLIEAVNAAKVGNGEYRVEYRLAGEGGVPSKWYLSSGRVQYDTEGVPRRLVGVTLNVTNLREASLRREHLEARLREKEHVEMLGIIAGGIVHDFNNLLVGIMRNAELAAMTALRGSEQEAIIKRISDAAARSSELSQQLLGSINHTKPEFASLDLNVLITQMARLMRGRLSPTAAVRLSLEPALPSFVGEATLVRQIVMNLLANASDALSGKRGIISVRTSLETLDESSARDFIPGLIGPGRYAVLRVEDSGCGMDEATRQRLFEPFFTTKPTGRGLGLSVVRRTLEQLCAGIKIESRIGVGSAFTVVFPLFVTLGQLVSAANSSSGGTLPKSQIEPRSPGMSSIAPINDADGLNAPR